MTTFLYTTTSEGGTITNPAAVEDLVSMYYFSVEPEITPTAIIFTAVDAPNGGFEVLEQPESHDACEEKFFTELSEYLESSLTVKSVETQGQGPPAAWSWTVTPDGDVTMNSL